MTPRPPVRRQITPIDPESDKGRDLAERLSVIFADVRANIAARKALAAKQAEEVRPPEDPE